MDVGPSPKVMLVPHVLMTSLERIFLSKPTHQKQPVVMTLMLTSVTFTIYDLSEDFDVVYESPNGDQVVSMEYDDPDSGVSLDRSSYPQNTDVEITIDHQALNVDPTSSDEWVFNSDGEVAFYGDASEVIAAINAANALVMAAENATGADDEDATASEVHTAVDDRSCSNRQCSCRSCRYGR